MTIETNIVQNSDDSITIISNQNDRSVSDIIDGNKYLQNSYGKQEAQYKGDSNLGQRVARIPVIIVEQMMREGIWGDQDKMRSWLNDPDNKYFRTTNGTV